MNKSCLSIWEQKKHLSPVLFNLLQRKANHFITVIFKMATCPKQPFLCGPLERFDCTNNSKFYIVIHTHFNKSEKVESWFFLEKLKYWVTIQWGKSYLILVDHPSSDDVPTIIPYGVDVLLNRQASHPIFSYWVG